MNEEFAFETFAEQPFSLEMEEETEVRRGARSGARRFSQRPRRRIYRTRPIVDPRYSRPFRRRVPVRRRIRRPIPQLVWPGWVFPPGYAQPFPGDFSGASPQPRPAGGGGSAGFGSPVPPVEPVDAAPDVDVEPVGVEAPDNPEPTDSEFFFGNVFAALRPFVPTPVENPGGGRIKDKRAPNKSDIVNVRGVQRQIPLHRLAAEAWQAMVDAARADGLAEPLLRPVSGFRDPAHQAVLWKRALERYGSAEKARKWVAPPGSSPHQSGRAMDLYLGGSNDSANVAKLRTLPAYRWLVGNARRFGFYPYEAEPWHWEFNPPAATSGEIGFKYGQCTCPR